MDDPVTMAAGKGVNFKCFEANFFASKSIEVNDASISANYKCVAARIPHWLLIPHPRPGCRAGVRNAPLPQLNTSTGSGR